MLGAAPYRGQESVTHETEAFVVGVQLVLVVIGLANFPQTQSAQGIAVLVGVVAAGFAGFQARAGRPVVRLLRSDFDTLWGKWVSAHGIPEGYIEGRMGR